MVNNKKNSKRQKHTQKMYKMMGCSSNCKIKSHHHKKYLGGEAALAYPSTDVPKTPNPYLAYSGDSNVDATNKIYPSSGPAPNGFNFLNPQNFLNGGSNTKLHKGGCGCSLQQGGSYKNNLAMKGGNCSAGNGGIPYPNGLLGKSWTPNPAGWPGVTDVAMNNNHLGYNTYSPVDISRQMVNEFSNPFKLIGGRRKHKKLTKHQKTKHRKNKHHKTKKLHGGALSNLLAQDFVNVGRQLGYGAGSTYNAVLGYPAPTNPLPWKDQLPSSLTYVNALKSKL
jgi:hypothetical protein